MTRAKPFFLVALLIVLAATAAHAAPRPNIVIIMADDMGYSDLGCYGGEIDTPNLDSLAAGGVRFTQFYNTARCCPTRAALLTGLYQHQAGVGNMVNDLGVPSYQGYLNDRCRTIAEVLGPARYTTLMTGKWHVGSERGRWPLDRGFDRYFGTPSGGGFYYKEAMDFRKRFLVLDNDIVEYPRGGYTTDMFTDYAIKFVDEAAKSDKPFFLYLAHIAPHWPLQAKPADVAKYRGRYDVGWDVIRQARFERQRQLGLIDPDWELSPRDPQARPWSELTADERADLSHRMSVYAAQIDCIDQNIGRLVTRLKDLGVLDDTLILFLSDNGCSAEGGPGGFRRGDTSASIGTPTTYASVGLEWANVSDTPLRRFKKDTYEGGIATPLIAHWPAGISRRGELESQPGHVIDLMATCVELAGADYPSGGADDVLPLEGRSLVPAFHGQPIARDAIYWEHLGNRAVRVGDMKLVAANKSDWELYDLAADRTEQHDLADQRPDDAAELAARWQAWADRCGVLPWPVKKK